VVAGDILHSRRRPVRSRLRGTESKLAADGVQAFRFPHPETGALPPGTASQDRDPCGSVIQVMVQIPLLTPLP